MITIEIGNLEIELGGLLGALLHIQREIGEIVYLSPRAAMGRLAVLQNVAEATLEKSEALNHLKDIFKRANKVLLKRNDMIHQPWGVHKNKKQVHRLAVPPNEKQPSWIVPINELNDFVEDIRELAQDVRKTTEDVYRAWPPYTLHPICRE